MFTIDQIQKLSDLEYSIYRYIEKNKDTVIHQKIKDIAEELHVSPSMITRVCKKLDCDGFGELKIKLRIDNERRIEERKDSVDYLLHYFNKMNTEKADQLIVEASKILRNSKDILFFGVGLSGVIAKYGSYLFNRKGLKTTCVEDFSVRFDGIYDHTTCAVVLTVSGETKEVNERIVELQRNQVRVIVITNNQNTTAARLGDVVISYYMPNTKNKHYHNSATQVPTIYILENLVKDIE
jgi:Transcriptional regulators